MWEDDTLTEEELDAILEERYREAEEYMREKEQERDEEYSGGYIEQWETF